MPEQESLINSEQEVKDEVGEVAERPEWLPEKFFKDGNPDYEGLAKSYTEAETYIGKKKEDLTAEIKTQMEADVIKNLPETPDKYSLPEIPDSYNTDTPLMDGWKKYCHENKLGQEAFNKGIDLFIESQPAPNLEEEKQKLGENANQRIEAVSLWVNKNFDEAQKPMLEMMCSTSSGVEAVEKIMNMLQNSMSNAPESTQTLGKTRADLQEMMKDRKYWHPTSRDENYVKQIDTAFEKLYK
tara:strand:- start:933 stop:1655 length:723 start_codon:yes stop_codon:yes gene_type:complete